jgi:2-succinyl-5-enolpyruvyl-6-hydroxy-3-cyclohexene-1-carboxylate synthase
MSNMSLTQKTLQSLLAWGVKDIVLCPGGRNAPFVFSLSENKNFVVHSAFDERAAAFFALGKAQAEARPAAIITTSGTAVAEVLPCVIEAFYTQTPLIVISADRPSRMRGTGAPQTIDQLGIFGSYVEKCVDVEDSWPAEISWSGRAPLHLNICFDEPLRDGEPGELKPEAIYSRDRIPPSPELAIALEEFLRDKKQPLLLISGLKTEEVAYVKKFADAWPGFIYAESTSGLREMAHPGLITSGDRFPTWLLKNKKIDGVLRLGGVPTARLWRDLETSDFPIFSISSLPFAGLSRGTFFCAEALDIPALAKDFSHLGRDQESEAFDKKIYENWQQLIVDYPRSEPALVQWLSQQLKASSTVYVGNSLPIREWDLVAQRKKSFHVKANRGANGIDGQIATALGHRTKTDLCVLVGDLTAMYDTNALWFLQNQKHLGRLFLVVMNNRGGKIFERLFKHPLFYNEHGLNFKSWAESWNCGYSALSEPGALPETSGVIELLPDLEQTASFWKKFDGLWVP